MAKSILNHKKLLLVGDAQEISGLLEQTILIPCPHCCIEKATTYEDAVTLLISKHYDLVFLDMVEAWGSELLKVAVERNFKVIVLTSNGLNTEDLNKAYHLGAVAYLPTTLLDELIIFSEDMLKHDSIAAWQHLVHRLEFSAMAANNPIETYELLCFANYFVDLMIDPNTSSE